MCKERFGIMCKVWHHTDFKKKKKCVVGGRIRVYFLMHLYLHKALEG